MHDVQRRLLILDPDVAAGALLFDVLGSAGYRLDQAANIEHCRARLADESFDLLLLDTHLPEGDGLDLLAELRATTDIPVFVLCSRGDQQRRLRALEYGADAYLLKPLDLNELSLRLRNFFRRHGGPHQRANKAEKVSKRIHMGDGLLLPDEHRLLGPENASVTLTRGERDILLALVNAEGGLQSRQNLANLTSHSGESISDETITVLVYRLRKKLLAVSIRGVAIETVSGAGYRLSTLASA